MKVSVNQIIQGLLLLTTAVGSSSILAEPVTFIYSSSTTNGAGAVLPVELTFTFDDESEAISHAENIYAYSPWSGELTLDGNTFNLTDGQIVVFNDAGAGGTMDAYYLIWSRNESSEGLVNGVRLQSLTIALNDQSGEMFDSTALPLTPDFSSEVDNISDDIRAGANCTTLNDCNSPAYNFGFPDSAENTPRIFSLNLYALPEPEAIPSAIPTDAIESLSSLISSLGLHKGTENSLLSKLKAAINAISDSNSANDIAAVNSMLAFCSSVKAQQDRKIPSDQAQLLMESAGSVIYMIDPLAPPCL